MVERKCIGCGEIKNRDDMIKITKQDSLGTPVINHSSKIFGRSAYLCYNKTCVEAAFKKNKISKILKAPIPETLKGKLINEF